MLSQIVKLLGSGFLLLLQVAPASAQNPFVVPLGQITVDAVVEGIGPGDVVCLQAGNRSERLRLINFNGTPAAPIIIQNCNGQTVIDVRNQNVGYSIALLNSNYVRLTGAGDPNYEYGIVTNGGTMGVTVGGLSGNGIEVDHIRANYAEFAGFMAKTDPTCDPATWRENFVMQDLKIHHNYAYHSNDGEGFYIGYTFSDGRDIECNGQIITVYGHLIEGLDLHHNKTEDTGAEGIQIGSSPSALIHHNDVYKAGQRPFADFQNNGIQIGYESVYVYNNRVTIAGGSGLIIFGPGHRIFNNLVVAAGNHGVFADDRATGEGLTFVNNTVVQPGADGVRIYYDETGPSTVKNNLIVDPAGDFYIKINGNVVYDESNNYFADTLAQAAFSDPASGNYYPQQDAPTVDAGADVSALGIVFDLIDTTRPQGGVFDIGAYEWAGDIDLNMPQRLYPENDAQLTTQYDWPRFSFEAINGVEWYNVWIGLDDYSYQALFQWYEAAQICTGGTCTLPLNVWLADGDYEWWMTYWGPNDTNLDQYWNRTRFSVDFAAPSGAFTLTSPTNGATVNPLQAIEWARDTNVLWYQVWVGTDDYANTIFFNWVDATEICDATTCSLDVSGATFPNGGYEVWAEMWGPNGYVMWPTTPSATFNVADNG